MKLTLFKKTSSTYTKVISLLTVMSLCLLLLVISLYYYMKVQEKNIYDTSNRVYKQEINSLLKLNTENYISLITEITYWDEFVDFIKTKDLKWFNSSVASVIDNYKVEYVCAYDTSGKLLTKVSTPKIRSSNFISQEAINKLLKKKIDKFYLKIPEGIIEVYGATIHPSDDPYKNKTKPAGCFFMVRLLDNEYFANFEKISTSNIEFFKLIDKNSKAVYYILPLKDYKNKTVEKLFFKRAYNIDFWITRYILITISLALFLSWIIYYYYANKWSRAPLSYIKSFLKTGDKVALEALKNVRGEFRYIGKLFEENQQKTIELEKAKIKAEEGEKLKSAFLMNLSHEVRTPMNAIIGFSDLLLNPNLTQEEKAEYIKIIHQSGKNLIEIIDDLVEMSKIEINSIEPNIYAVNIDTIVQSVFDSIVITNKNPKIEIKLIKPKKELKKDIRTDGVKINQILINLLNNAIKFTDEGYVILDYDVDEIKKEIVFTVKDSGIGIPEEYQEKIFKRFNKIGNTKISANEGLGLGLAIAKAYVEMLGGNITLTSQPGVGSVFSFNIPLHYEDLKRQTILEGSKINYSQGEEELILVAEDDNINFALIKKILNSANYNVIRACDGVEAIKIAQENEDIDLILMDIKMPNLNGYEAYIKIREFNSQIPIIAQTSYSFPEEIERIKQIGFSDFISKPLNKEKLLELVGKYFNKI